MLGNHISNNLMEDLTTPGKTLPGKTTHQHQTISTFKLEIMILNVMRN